MARDISIPWLLWLLVIFQTGAAIRIQKIGSVTCQCTCQDINDPFVRYNGNGDLNLKSGANDIQTTIADQIKYQPIVRGHTMIDPNALANSVPKLSESYQSKTAVQSIEKIKTKSLKGDKSFSSRLRNIHDKHKSMLIPLFDNVSQFANTTQSVDTSQSPNVVEETTASDPKNTLRGSTTMESTLSTRKITTRSVPFSTVITVPDTTPQATMAPETTTTNPTTTSTLKTTASYMKTTKTTTTQRTTTPTPATTRQKSISIVRHRPSSRRPSNPNKVQNVQGSVNQKWSKWQTSNDVFTNTQSSRTNLGATNSRSNNDFANTRSSRTNFGATNSRANNDFTNTRSSQTKFGATSSRSNNFINSRPSRTNFGATNAKSQRPVQPPSANTWETNPSWRSQSSRSNTNTNNGNWNYQPKPTNPNQWNSWQNPASTFQRNPSRPNSVQSRTQSNRVSSRHPPPPSNHPNKFPPSNQGWSNAKHQSWSSHQVVPVSANSGPTFSFKSNVFGKPPSNHGHSSGNAWGGTTPKPTTTTKRVVSRWGLSNIQENRHSDVRGFQNIPANENNSPDNLQNPGDPGTLKLFVTIPRLSDSESVTLPTISAKKITKAPTPAPRPPENIIPKSKANSTSSNSIRALTGLVNTLKLKNGDTGVASLLKNLMNAKSKTQMESMISQLKQQVHSTDGKSQNRSSLDRTKVRSQETMSTDVQTRPEVIATQSKTKDTAGSKTGVKADATKALEPQTMGGGSTGLPTTMSLLDRDIWQPEPTHPSERNFVTIEGMTGWEYTTPVSAGWQSQIGLWNKQNTNSPQITTPSMHWNQESSNRKSVDLSKLGPLGSTLGNRGSGQNQPSPTNIESWMPLNTPWNNQQSFNFGGSQSMATTPKNWDQISVNNANTTPKPVETSVKQNLPTTDTATKSVQSKSNTPNTGNSNNAKLLELLKQLTASRKTGATVQGSSVNTAFQQLLPAMANLPGMHSSNNFMSMQSSPHVAAGIPGFGLPGFEFPGAGGAGMGAWENFM